MRKFNPLLMGKKSALHGYFFCKLPGTRPLPRSFPKASLPEMAAKREGGERVDVFRLFYDDIRTMDKQVHLYIDCIVEY